LAENASEIETQIVENMQFLKHFKIDNDVSDPGNGHTFIRRKPGNSEWEVLKRKIAVGSYINPGNCIFCYCH
jgi:hypothetical protein